MTNEQIRAKLVQAYKTCKSKKDEVMQNEIVFAAGFSPEEKKEILGDKKWADVLPQFGFEVYKNDKNELAVRLVQNVSEVSSEKNIPAQSSQSASETNASEKIHDRIEKLIEIIGVGLYEKETAVKLGLLTALAGESMFMIGAPGCAKSMIVRRIKEAFAADGKKYFETLLNQFTTPEEVYGNISLKALNGELEDENGNKNEKEEYRRLTEGFLPEADIAFLDEIWKANPAILNTLLTIVNEKKFHNGNKIQPVPLKALFAASNEFPKKDKGLDALYDRFIIRLPVSFIQDEDSFFEMISSPGKTDFSISEEDKKLLITNEELKNWAAEIDKVTLSDVAKEVILAIRKEMQSQNDGMSEEEKRDGEMFEVGDRRWKKIAHILKTSAFINDRDEVDLMDCSLIEHCIWGTEKQQEKAKEIVEKCLKENGLQYESTSIKDIEDAIKEFDSWVTENFYRLKKEKPSQYKMKDGNMAYKFVKPIEFRSHNTVEPYYISENYYYDKNKENLGSNDKVKPNSLQINENEISWIDYYRERNSYNGDYEHTQEIEMKKGEYEKNPEIFKRPDIYESIKKLAQEKSQSIVQNINEQVKTLEKFRAKQEAPFRANIFAEQNYCDAIMDAANDAKTQLADANVDLEKVCYRYENQ